MNICKRILLKVDKRQKESKQLEEEMRARWAEGRVDHSRLTDDIQGEDDSKSDKWEIADEDEQRMQKLLEVDYEVECKWMVGV